MAEVAVVASMPVLEKPADASAAALAKKKPPSSSSKDKKRKGKGLSDPALTAEAPVAKKPRSSGAIATVVAHTAIHLVAGSKAMQTLICRLQPVP
ncbi:hypothetical protein BDA96_01G328800 [Sorghum bicolor]|uniref:Uncharacterized protein n=1 Tax=Sorghum bicolor TaxID=4558 RepID=A0A921S2S7_SORBI|nr:hypothetical protein BDA96_01G328800 [Sorghum bicolor]